MYLGFDAGGTSLKAGIFDDDINLMQKYFVPYHDIVKTNDFPEFLLEQIFKIWNEATDNYPQIKAVGIGVPGVVSNEGVIAVAPNLKGIVKYPILQLLKNKINQPLAVDNDANTAALAELYYGNGADLNDFIYVTLGTGIGGCIITGRMIFRGSSGGAGEIGHIIIEYKNSQDDPRPYREGVIEVFAGREGILRLAENILNNYPKSELNKHKNYDVAEISKFADMGDDASIEILQITGYKIGCALVSAANILDIPNFVVGGGISRSALLLKQIENTLKRKAIPSVAARIKLTAARFVEDTGIVGAAVLAKFYAN
ncbi:MAG: ROK family protein [Candidatus Kapabacteria bacterium]|jgi:glucokinase|nr:ROK family protein [Candidatus Kapabacteria bacterium]